MAGSFKFYVVAALVMASWVMASLVIPLSGVGSPQTAALGMEQHSVWVHGEQRYFWLYTPSHYNASQPLPVVMAVHGFRMNALMMASTTGFNKLAEQENFLVLYPDGGKHQWNGKAVANHNNDDVDYVNAILDTTASARQIDQTRLYLTGFSNGGFFSQRLACDMPGRFAAIATVGSTMGQPLSEECSTPKQTPVMLIHGTNDPVITWEGQIRRVKVFFKTSNIISVPQTLSFWQKANHCQSKPATQNLIDVKPNDGLSAEQLTFSCARPNALTLWMIHGGGHTWPGSKNDHWYDSILLGKTSHDIRASTEIWKFFQSTRMVQKD
ncbi:MAG: PHB depolymerase family esterase [Vampirovibrionales bacterium]|nr:PHB depolymerase family esterase [Vampirovibrionales bacterium]